MRCDECGNTHLFKRYSTETVVCLVKEIDDELEVADELEATTDDIWLYECNDCGTNID